MIDVVTNVRIIFGKPKGKAGGIFSVVLGFKLGEGTEYLVSLSMIL